MRFVARPHMTDPQRSGGQSLLAFADGCAIHLSGLRRPESATLDSPTSRQLVRRAGRCHALSHTIFISANRYSIFFLMALAFYTQAVGTVGHSVGADPGHINWRQRCPLAATTCGARLRKPLRARKSRGDFCWFCFRTVCSARRKASSSLLPRCNCELRVSGVTRGLGSNLVSAVRTLAKSPQGPC